LCCQDLGAAGPSLATKNRLAIAESHLKFARQRVKQRAEAGLYLVF